jgi:predicted NBD/HSP70 family sugar kinase
VSARGTPTGNQASLREANRTRVVAALRQSGGLTQVELAGMTGLSQATVHNIVKELTGVGVLHTTPTTRSGRRALRVSLAHGLGLVVGVHISPRRLRVALVDADYTVVAEHHMPLARDHRADNELDKAVALIMDMIESVDSSLVDVLGIGVAIGAPVDHRTGMIARRGILRGWDGIVIADAVRRRIDKPVHVENASNCAAIAEARLGAARGKDDVLVLEIGEGIGSGLLISGHLVRGFHGVAGEFGHTTVEPNGPLCRCGNRGCLEAVAAAPAVLDTLAEELGVRKTSDLILKAMSGNDACIRALADAGRVIGRTAAGLVNVLDSERVVVGGEFARAGELLLGPMRHAFEASLLVEPDGTPDLIPGQLGDDAAVLGAVAVALDETVADAVDASMVGVSGLL